MIFSRTTMGLLLINNIEYLVLPSLLTKIINEKENPSRLFRCVSKISEHTKQYQNYDKIFKNVHFTENEKNGIKNFFFSLKDQNRENLIFLIEKMSIDYRDYESSVSQKIKDSACIKKDVQQRFEKLDVFIGDDIHGNWSNKAFLNTIKFLAILEAINDVRNNEWKKITFVKFFYNWLQDLSEVMNYYSLEEDNIVIYVEGLSDKIILENAYNKLHPKHNNFVFYDVGGTRELVKKIDASKISDFGKMSFGIFDFDRAYEEFNGLKKDKNRFGEIEGSENECLFRIREDEGRKIFALLLPIPEDRKMIASSIFGGNSKLSIEMLFNDEILEYDGNLREEKVPGGSTIHVFTGDKIKFAEKTKDFKIDNF